MGLGAAIGVGLLAGATVYSANKASSAAKKSGEIQAEAAREAANLQREMYYQTRRDLTPWRVTGQNALSQLWNKVQRGPGQYQRSPGYQFRLQEGQKAIERGAAARGGVLSGAAQKALLRYGQNYATQDYDNFLRRYYQSLAPLQSLSGLGQTTGVQLGQAAQNYATNAGQMMMKGAAARGTGYIQSANAFNQGVNSLVNLAGTGLGMYGGYKGWW